VRSIEQLSQTELFRPEEYDELTMVANEVAYVWCRRLVSEESLIAGPSSALALAGACEIVPDEPGNLAVVIFPELFESTAGVGEAPAASSPNDVLMAEMIENAKRLSGTIEIDEAHEMMNEQGALFIDVRSKEQFESKHVKGAVSMPLEEIGRNRSSLPEDKDAPLIAVCGVGRLSVTGMLYLRSLGYTNAKSMNGGTSGWAAKGLPTDGVSSS
jgi:rhodanese-related sulfurtransferase